MKKVILLSAMLTMFVGMNAQTLTSKPINENVGYGIVPKLFIYGDYAYLVCKSENDKSTIDVYDGNFEKIRSFNINLGEALEITQYRDNYGEWVTDNIFELKNSVIGMSFQDFDENSYPSNARFNFSQTLFNDDEKFEFVVSNFGENLEDTLEYDWNGDGVAEYREITHGKKKGYRVVNEDGDTLLSFPESLDFDSHGGTLIRLGGNIYISPDDGHTIRQKTTYYQIGKKIENMEGDVNGDGTVNIADVTKLVNIILQQ